MPFMKQRVKGNMPFPQAGVKVRQTVKTGVIKPAKKSKKGMLGAY